MAIQLQLRRGTTAENNAFTGAVGELTMNTDTKTLRIHDGETIGGVEIPSAQTADYVVEWQAPTDLNNYTWYRKYKSGWVEQGVTGKGVITLPIPMANTQYSIVATRLSSSADFLVSAISVSTTQIQINLSSGTSAYWKVCGMGA